MITSEFIMITTLKLNITSIILIQTNNTNIYRGEDMHEMNNKNKVRNSVELRKNKHLNYITFAEHIAKINIKYLQNEISSDQAMQSINLMIGKLVSNLKKLENV